MRSFCKFAAFVFASLLFALVPRLAQACSCAHPYPSDYIRSVDQVFDGFVEKVWEEAATETSRGDMRATVRVLHVWKGELPEKITFVFGRQDAACEYGSLHEHSTQRFFAHGDPDHGSITSSWCDRMIGHHGGWPLQRELRLYAERLAALTETAKDGTAAKRLELAQFLLSHGEEAQAVRVFEPILKDEPSAFEDWVINGNGYDYISKIDRRYWVKDGAPVKPDAKGQVARAVFVLTGRLDPSWKDWSNLQPASGCRVDGVLLTDVSFANSILSNCSFQGARLRNVDFSGAEIRSGSFERAQLSDVRLDGHSVWGISFKDAHLERVSISGGFHADLSRAELENVTVTNLNLGVFDLSGAKLRNVSFVGGDIRGVETNGASFENVQFTGSRLLFWKLQGTDLRGADFSGVKELTGYVDCNTHLPESIKVDRPTLIPVQRNCPLGRPDGNFRGVNWSYFDLSDLDFRNVDFTGAVLQGVTLIGTDLRNTNLSGVNFRYAKFSGAKLDGAKLDHATQLGWFAAPQEIVADRAGPASVKGTKFAGTTVTITSLAGMEGANSSIDFNDPDFSGATIDCDANALYGDAMWSSRDEAVNKARQEFEAAAIRRIQAKWPTAQLTTRCAAQIAKMP